MSLVSAFLYLLYTPNFYYFHSILFFSSLLCLSNVWCVHVSIIEEISFCFPFWHSNHFLSYLAKHCILLLLRTFIGKRNENGFKCAQHPYVMRMSAIVKKKERESYRRKAATVQFFFFYFSASLFCWGWNAKMMNKTNAYTLT